MANPFLAEVRMFGFNFAPYGWMLCQGQTLPISQYAAVFSLIGTYYGGNGQSNFQLPNCQGNAVIDYGQGPGLQNYDIGQTGGAETVQVTLQEMPSHNHALTGDHSRGTSHPAPSNTTVLADSSGGGAYVLNGVPTTPLGVTSVGTAGGNQPHNNMMPYLTVNFCIAMQGVFPART